MANDRSDIQRLKKILHNAPTSGKEAARSDLAAGQKQLAAHQKALATYTTAWSKFSAKVKKIAKPKAEIRAKAR